MPFISSRIPMIHTRQENKKLNDSSFFSLFLYLFLYAIICNAGLETIINKAMILSFRRIFSLADSVRKEDSPFCYVGET